MNYFETKQRLELSGALRILKRDTAPLIIGFLHATFRAEHAVARSESDMVERLTAFIERVHEGEGRVIYTAKAKELLTKWCDEFGVLRNRYNEKLELVYEMTPDADAAIAFIEGSVRVGFAGTESKLKTIAEKLREIVENTDDDRNRRIDRLREERARIDDEIQALLLGGEVKVYSQLEVRERYQLIIDLALSLRRDFTIIKDRFKALAGKVLEQHSLTGTKRGRVLRGAIDDELVLRESDEGRSFTAFQHFLLQPESQERFFALIDAVEALGAIGREQRADRVLRSLPGVLLAESRGVVETNQRLSLVLRNLLDSTTIRARQESAELLNGIKTAAFKVKDEPPPGVLLEVNGELNLEHSEVMGRVVWEEGDNVKIPGALSMAAGGDKEAALAALAAVEHVDFERLAGQIEDSFVKYGNLFRLSEVLNLFPLKPERVILDLLGYYTLARQNEDWKIERSQDREIRVEVPGTGRAFRLPQILFYRPGAKFQ